MKHFEEFNPSGDSFEDRDHPSALCSALGRVALGFAELDQRVEATILALAQNGEHDPFSSFHDRSFARKLDLLENMITNAGQRRRFNVGDFDAAEVLAELIQLLKRADELYRETVDPRLLRLHLWNEFPKELPAEIMDVADYLMGVDMQLEEFFLVEDPVM